MIFSVSGVLLLGVVCFILFRKHGLKGTHMVICMLFGFYLASTSIGPHIASADKSIAGFVGALHF